MRFLKKNFWTLSCLALVMVMAVSGNALADGNTLMETAQTKAKSVFSSVKTIIFIVGGFGLVGLAFQAIFLGSLLWPSVWLFWPLPVPSLNTLPVPAMPVWKQPSVTSSLTA